MRLVTATLLAFLFAAGHATTARAAESYHNCTGFIDSIPTTISTQGTWCLRKDVSTSMASGAAITVANNNITIDCNDFKVGGLLAGDSTLAVGIRAGARSNLTIRNCTVRGFHTGILLGDPEQMPNQATGGGHLVVDNRLDLMTAYGLLIMGQGSLVKGNTIVDTGAGANNHTAYGIHVAHGVDVIDNTVSGVQPETSNGWVYGIYLLHNSGTIRGNRIRGLVKKGTGKAYGIQAWTNYEFALTRPVFRDNDLLIDYDTAGSTGIRCSGNEIGAFTQTGRAKDNVIGGFSVPIEGCGDGGGNDLD